jgi:hypothetical protein
MSIRTAIWLRHTRSTPVLHRLLRKENNYVDWDGHLGTLMGLSSKYIARRHEHFEHKKEQETAVKEFER